MKTHFFTGSLIEMQNFSVNDGDGIRTTIFFAGCPLSCKWCANPEGLSLKDKVGFYKNLCVGCKRCEKVCKMGIGIDLNIEREKCVACGMCVDVCPTGARRMLTYKMEIEEIVEKIKPQMLFYRKSGGGVTFSGGEATLQTDFLRELTRRLYDMGINLSIETCGYFDFDEVKDILSMMDLIFIDMKHISTEEHTKFTGKDNIRIKENIRRVSEINIPVVVRIPLIKGVNCSKGIIFEIAKFVSENNKQAKIELLPYHTMGESKYIAIGMPIPECGFLAPTEAEMKIMSECVVNAGVDIISFR